MELPDVHYLEWVSVPLNRGGEEPRGGATLSLFLGEPWSKPRAGGLGAFPSSLLQEGGS